MGITKVIAEALGSPSPPSNESNTCDWVILPILYEIGYGKREVVSRDADSAGKFPDYTLLPSDPEHTFYLEAKSWEADLKDSHANQAINYANQNGKRWVVLTNGRHWCLYDNYIHGKPEDKMVAEMQLEHGEQAVRFLEAIGRASVSSGMLPGFATEEGDRRRRLQEEGRRRLEITARRARLSSVFEAELTGESSPLVALVLAHLRGRDGLGEITAGDVVAHFAGEATGECNDDPAGGSPPSEEVLVIPARNAWPEYLAFSAYMCQPNRAFRPTSRIAFYSQGYVEALVPRILERVPSVNLSGAGVATMKGLTEVTRARLLALLESLRAKNDRRHMEGDREVLLLSGPKDSDTITLPYRIKNDCVTKNGRPWAFVVGQRYVHLARLLARAKTTSELAED